MSEEGISSDGGNVTDDSVENVVILGSGCAGYTAAIYTARANLNPLLISGKEEGGQLMLTSEIENFPGFENGIMGPEFMGILKKQAKRFGTRFKLAFAKGVVVREDGIIEIDVSGETVLTKSLIVATGASARWLGLDSEQEYKGRGVHTCATCDGYFYQDKEIIIVGGGDSACEEGNFLTKYAKKVTMLVRRDVMRASKIMQDRALKNPKIEVQFNSRIKEIKGDGKTVSSVVIEDTVSGETRSMDIDGIFLAIGHIPNTKFLEGVVDLDDHGFVKTSRDLHTNVSGVFAAGDVQDTKYKQAITAAGTGCQAALEAEKYLEGLE